MESLSGIGLCRDLQVRFATGGLEEKLVFIKLYRGWLFESSYHILQNLI
jgi:hypothetical protein